MALIKCNECGKEMSDKATVCVNCGNPIEQNRVTYANYDINIKTDNVKSEKDNINLYSLSGFIISIIAFFVDFFGLVSALGLILSIIGLTSAINQKSKIFAIIGIILSIIELGYKLILLIGWLSLLN